MNRAIEPELLDSLPADDPDAAHSRRDLLVINKVMGNERWFRREFRRLLLPRQRVLELGAGNGEMGAALFSAGFAIDGLDLLPRPAVWPAQTQWHRADLRAFGRYGEYSAVMANLVLHHLTAADLANLGMGLSGARLIIASEPARLRRSQVLCAAMAPLIGANRVTRHDARVSIAAGFLRDELPSALGLASAKWRWECDTSPLGAYRMIAVRR